MTEIITFSTSKKVRDKLDKLRGDIARSKFISHIIEKAIEQNGQQIPTIGESLEKPGQLVGNNSIQGGESTDG